MSLFHHLRRRFTGARDYLDGVQGDRLVGWALPRPGNGPVPVALYDAGGRVADMLASQFRADLQEAGLAGGHCGFSFLLGTETGRLRVCRLDGPHPVEIGAVVTGTLPAAALPPAGISAAPQSALLRDVLGPGLRALRAPAAPARDRPAPLTAKQALLFAAEDPGTGAPLPDPLCAYMAYLRPRHRQTAQFPWEEAPEEAAHFLHWMLTSYAPMRGALRPPLSKRAIQWLNAPVITPGHRIHLSRATWAALMAHPPLRRDLDLGDPVWLERVIQWWAIEQARAISGEDCLVPRRYVTRLAGLPAEQMTQTFPLSRYMLRWRAETPALAQMPADTDAGRRQITLAAMVRAAERPDTLRYLPCDSVETLLDEGAGGQTPLGAYLTGLDGQSQLVSRADYVACLRGRGYDLQARHFTTRSAEGHRLHAAALPAPARATRTLIDLQVIGPVTKASGLGQAMRASLCALETTGLGVQVVNFDLDNPAPDTDIPHIPIAEARPARFTLLHLNAETLPLFTAYAPDITDGSYSAAYMFWELTRPATCHALALRLVDEIWSASPHGKAIYAPCFDGPVRVMGLASDVPPCQDPLAARAAFVARTGFAARAFLCMTSFDSFSFVQRKNPLALIRAFAAAFPQGDAQLLIKTQNRARVSDPAQRALWAELDALVAGDARFCLLDDTLTRTEMLDLMAGADAYLSLHRAEGWGFGMIEAMALGVPVLATGYSGNLAFCTEATAWLVPATEVPPAPQAYMFTPDGGLWGEPDPVAARDLLRQMSANTALRLRKAKAAQALVAREFSPEAVGARYASRIETVLRQQAGQRV